MSQLTKPEDKIVEEAMAPKKKGRPSSDGGGLGHDELRDRWIERYPHMGYSGGDWWSYGDGIWQRADHVAVEAQIIDVLEGSREEGVKVTGHLVGSVMRIAKAAVYLPSDIWDANPRILVCENGTLDLESRELRGWSPNDYVTARVPYSYAPEARADVFLAVLNQALPESRDFIQEYAGYCLTTDTSHEMAIWFKGPRGCGKSTIMEGFSAMLGPRSGILGLAEIESSPFALAKIPGKTLLTSTEQPASYLKSTHVIDAVISGEKIMVDRKYRDAEEVSPVAKIIWAMNDLPRIGNTTSGIFRRVRIVDFPALEGERDPDVKEYVKEEGAGVLNWALEGLEGLRKRGRFVLPEKVIAATEAFEYSNDLPTQFVEECCLTGPEHETAAGMFYTRYAEWCRDNGHHPPSSNRVNDDWLRLGFKHVKRSNRKFWKGVTTKGGSE